MDKLTDERVEINEDSPPWTCIYCGAMWPKEEPVEALQAHVLVCEQHPTARLRLALGDMVAANHPQHDVDEQGECNHGSCQRARALLKELKP
jgi:hypothetical protein